MKRPLTLTVVGCGWIFLALASLLAETFRQGGVQIPSNSWFYMLVGAGLLSGWRWCRWYALFVTGAGFVLALCFAPWMLMHTERLVINFPSILINDRQHEVVPLMAIVSLLVIYLAISAWSFVVLMRQDVKQYFAPQLEKALS